MKHLRWSFLLALALLLVAFGVALADWTFTGYTGPDWVNNTLWRWTITVDTLTVPHKVICLTYSTTGGEIPETTIPCTGPGIGNTGTWTCEVPGALLATATNAPVNWEIDAHAAGSGGTCGNNQTGLGPSGVLNNPTAVALSSFQARAFPVVPVGAGLGLVAFLGCGTLLLRRRR